MGCKLQAAQVAASEAGQNTEIAIGNLKQQTALYGGIGQVSIDTMRDSAACVNRVLKK